MDAAAKDIRRRGSQRGNVTKLVNKIDWEIAEIATTPITKEQLTSYILQFEEKVLNLKELDSRIEVTIAEPDDYDKELKETEEWQVKCIDYKAICMSLLKNLEARPKSPTPYQQGAGTSSYNRGTPQNSPSPSNYNAQSNIPPSTGATPCNTPPNSPTLNRRPPISQTSTVVNPVPTVFNPVPTVKLQRITIDKFSGDTSKFQEFWAQFEITVHRHPNLADRDKLVYLKSYLTGTALTCVSGLNTDYKTAVDTLTDRFGRRELLIQAHIEQLRNMDPVKKSSDVKGLRRFYDILHINVKSLENLKVDPEAYGSFLIPIVTDLLPEDIVLNYSVRNSKAKILQINGLLECLKDEVESREQALKLKKPTYLNDTKKDTSNPKTFNSFSDKPKRNSATLNFTTSTSTPDDSCPFCKAKHKAEACEELTCSERKEILRSLGKCFHCLKSGHLSRFCRSKTVCKHCKRGHHPSVCEKKFPDHAPDQNTGESATKATVMSTITPKGEKQTIFLQTAWAKLSYDGKERRMRCFFDTGSHRTYITELVSRQLGLPVLGKEKLNIMTFGATNTTKVERRRVKLTLSSLYDSQSIDIEAVETPKISGEIAGFQHDEIFKLAEQKGWNLADTTPSGEKNADTEIALLIGADYYWKVVKGGTERISPSLMAVHTMLGWTLLGSIEATQCRQQGTSVYNVCVLKALVSQDESEEELVSRSLKTFWDLDSLGITNDNEDLYPNAETMKKNFESNVQFDGGRYTVKFPWKEDAKLPNDNYFVAERRFQTLLRKFRKNPRLFFEYAGVIETYLRDGIAEKVEDDDEGVFEKTFYLPHREVIKEDRITTKIRVVFDASSRAINNPSVNDCIHVGPSINVDLLGLLIKFRKNKVAFTADIEKAFLQVSLAEEDRDVTRFLWIQNRELEPHKVKLQTLRMTRVLFGINASPYLLGATIKFHAEKYKESHPQAYEVITESLYVDDVISGSDENSEALRLATEVKTILKDAGMPLRKFQSNSIWLKEKLGDDSDDAEIKKIKHESVSLKVLGIAWLPQKDVFCFDVKSLLEFLCIRKNTKRFLLQASSRIFDPVGFLSPFVIRIKCLFQELWERGTQWDDEIPADINDRWEKWCLELPHLVGIEIPRYYGEGSNNIQLHCFTDASEKAYGCTIYIRSVNDVGRISVNLLASKSRVAPLKRVTIPRLELMGAVIGTRLMKTVMNYFQKEKPVTFFWSDSTITLSWIKSSAKQWKPFVNNRVSEIQESSEPENWRHVSGKQNPADMLTRGLTVSEIISNEVWFYGPRFLKEKENEWKSSKIDIGQSTAEIDAEKRTNFQTVCLAIETDAEPLFKIEHFSKLSRVVRVTAWIFRFVGNSRKLPTERTKGEITSEEIVNSENFWIKSSQKQAYSGEIKCILEKSEFPKVSKLETLKPFLDEIGLLRLGGRFSDVDFEEKHPIIMAENCHLTKLFILKSHNDVMHMSVTATLSRIRSRMWIPRGRQIVKKIISRCLVCQRMKSIPFTQETAPLPPERVDASEPFQVTGVDFAGPVTIKTYNENKKGYFESKGYIALFTCATTRAVHLELVSNLTTANFLMAFKRFIARRGVCYIVMSDNAKTFKRSEKELRKLWDTVKSPEMKQYFGEKGVRWKYIVDRAPWWGGIWERMVRSMKGCMKKVLGRALLTYEELETTIIEVESVLNSRPITYCSSDQNDPSPLTPSHFLIGKRLDTLPSRICARSEVKRDDLTKRFKYRQEILNRFWVRWRNEYLLELRSAQNVKRSKETSPKLRVDDVVIIKDERLPRHLWKLGRIIELHPGRDGLVRAATLRNTVGHDLKRPLKLLFPVEVNE